MQTLLKLCYNYEIIVAEDGSNDGTYEILVELEKRNSKIRILHTDVRCGKGLALKEAIKSAKGNVIGFIDADLSTDMSYLAALINAVLVEDYDISIGSRIKNANKINRSKKRSLASMAYNLMVRWILGSKLNDHQCGFKAFKKSSIYKIIDQINDEQWFWDTEMLIKAQQNGYRIKEIPVRWSEANSTSFNLIKDGFAMGFKIIKLRWELSLKKEKPVVANDYGDFQNRI